MSLGLIHGGDVTRTWDATATAQSGAAAPHTAGDEAIVANFDGNGFRTYVFVTNTSGTGFAIGQAVSSVGGVGFSAVASSAADHPKIVLGVAQVAIADDRSGWVLKRGLGTILTDGVGVTAADLLEVGAAGVWSVAVADADVAGVAAATIGATALGSAYVNCGV